MSDIFRKEYKELTEEQKENIHMIKVYAEDLLFRIELAANIDSVDLVMMHLSRTRLEECVMWATKAIT